MATAYVSIGAAGSPSPYGGLPIWRGAARSETVTTSGTAASGSLTARTNEAAMIFCETAVYANTKGTASASAGLYVPASTPVYIAMAEGDVVSLIDA